MQYPVFVLLLVTGSVMACQPAAPEKEQSSEPAATDVPALRTAATFAEAEAVFNKTNDTLYVVNFWATWCKPCVAELPYFEQLRQAYTDKAVKVVLISLDFPNQIESKVVPFITENKVGSEVVVLTDPDADAWIPRVSPDWGGAIPVTMLVKNGQQQQFWPDPYESYAQLEAMIQPLL